MAPRSIRAARESAPNRRPTPFMERVRAGALSLAIQHENLEDKIYNQLRGLILERQILPGERIPMDHLAREMGVSRTPVLNALKRLAQERVVELLPRRGIYVRRFSKREMARVFELREVLEGLSARLACQCSDHAELDRWEAIFREFARATTPADMRRYMEQDRRFHRWLVRIAENEQLTAAIESIYLMYFAYQDGLVRPPSETAPEHLDIIEALRRRDPEASEAAMRLHMRRSRECLVREAKEDEVDGQEESTNRPRARGTMG